MNFIYHNGFLLQNRHGARFNRVWDLSDPFNPVQVRTYEGRSGTAEGWQLDAAGWSGHHVFTMIGETAILNWGGAASSQIDLSNLPDVETAEPLFHTIDDEMTVTYYPFSFRGVARSYDYDRIGTITIHDLRNPKTQRIARAWSEQHINTDWVDGIQDEKMPQLSRIDVRSQTGFEGRPNLIGNLLIITGDNEMPQGIAVYDLSDPSQPVLLDSIRTTAAGLPLIKAYDSVPIWGSYAFLIQDGSTSSQRGMDIIDFSDPTDLKHVGRFDFPGRIRYAQFQDEFMFVGNSMVNMNTFQVEQTFPESGGEYPLPLGNLLVTTGLDRPDTGRIWCHQAEPDSRPPMVTFHNPADGQTGVASTGRVGLVIPETLDLSSVNTNNVFLREIGGGVVEADLVMSDHDVLNLTPRAVLQDNTTYELIMPAGGISDVAGNALTEEFRFSFSTGDSLHSDPPPVFSRVALSRPVVTVGQPIQISARARDPQGGSVEYAVVWGDGEEEVLDGRPSATHRYQKPGIYQAQIQAVDEARNRSSHGLSVVVQPEQVHPSAASSPIAFDPRQHRVWNVNPDNNTVTAIDSRSGRLLLEVDVPADPRSIALSSSGDVWVVSHDAASISVLSGKNGNYLTEIPLHPGSAPVGLVLSPDGTTAYVSAMSEGKIYRIDTATRTVVDTLSVGPWPRALALSHDGHTLLATRFLSPDHQGEIYRIDTESFDTWSTIPLSADSTTEDTDRSGRGVPNYLISIAIAPDARTVWVGSKKDNIFRGMARDGRALTFENTVRSVLSFVDLQTGAEIPDARMDVDNHELPSAITFSPDGQITYVAFQGNNSISAFSTQTRQRLEQVASGRAPQGLVVDPDSGDLFVHSFLSRSVEKLSLFTGPSDSLGQFVVSHQTRTVKEEQLPEPVLLGKQLFYDASDLRISLDGYISCASCHLDGGHDGRVWDFTDRGEGLRNTTSLVSHGGLSQGRVHWSANFDEIQDFEHDMRSAFRGTGLLSNEQFRSVDHPLGAPKAGLSTELDALAAYVSSLSETPLSPYRDGDGSLTDAAQRGREIFREQECTSCHGGVAFTNSARGLRHDVGTLRPDSGQRLGGVLRGIDTPTLRNLWNTAPYLHNGSAGSLSEVLTEARHGRSDQLSESERADLVAYLQQIDGLEPAVGDSDVGVFTSSLGIAGRQNLYLTGDIETLEEQEVVYIVDEVEIGRSTEPPFTVDWMPELSGDYRVYASYQSNGATSISPEIPIQIELDQAAPEREGFALLWQDDFDTLDRVRWDMPTYIFDDSGAQFVYRMVTVEDGLLRMRISKSEGGALGGRPYLSGEIRTRDTFRYGRFEARVRFPSGDGIVSSFFTFYDYFSNTRPDRIEDWNQLIVQGLGRDVGRLNVSGMHWDDERRFINYQKITPLEIGIDEAFRIYTIEWLPDVVNFYLDDVLIHSIKGEAADMFRRESRLVMNIWPTREGAGAESWAGHFEQREEPAEVLFDWVRVYQYTPDQD